MSLLNIYIIAEDDFIEQFRPLPNILNDNASFDFGQGGCLYETFGPELDHVRAQPSKNIWTIVEADGELMIVSGYHFVNRLGYILSAVQWTSGNEVFVELEDLS